MDTDEKRLETETPSSAPVNKKRDRLISPPVIGALIGTIVGLIPVTIWTYIFNADFFPLYVLCPLAVYLFMRLFRTEYDLSSMTVLVFFSAFATYLALLSCQAAYHAVNFKMSALEIPLLTLLSLGNPENLPDTASSIVFPVIFSALGIFASGALLYFSRTVVEKPVAPVNEDLPDDEDEDELPEDEDVVEVGTDEENS